LTEGFLFLRQKLPEKVVDEKEDVVLRSRSRRNVDRDDVQAVEKVFRKRVLGHGFFEIAGSSRRESDVDLDRARAADPLELPLLDHPEKLDLQEKGSSPISSRKMVRRWRARSGRPRIDGAREAPFSCPNSSDSIRSGESLRSWSGTKRSAHAGAVEVDRLGDELLTRSAFAGDEDGAVGVGDLLDETVELLDLPEFPISFLKL